ncbi:MAG: hypothetical protein WAK04_11435, partial [Xanthobacteraceae bacterium]
RPVAAAGITLAARLAPLSNERREKSVLGTRAVVSSQQLITNSLATSLATTLSQCCGYKQGYG